MEELTSVIKLQNMAEIQLQRRFWLIPGIISDLRLVAARFFATERSLHLTKPRDWTLSPRLILGARKAE